MSSPALRPSVPLISNFVAPWDTSGWYAAAQHLSPGVKIYSNTDTQILALPETYLDADYIRMFDSEAEGFDDKQEICFRVERDAIVGIALDEDGPKPDGLDLFSPTSQTILTELGRWPIYERQYAANSLVLIPGMKGRGHHFFPMIRSAAISESTPLPVIDWPAFTSPVYPHRVYCHYTQETFMDSNALSRYDCSSCRLTSAPENGIQISGSLSYSFCPSTPRVVLDAILSSSNCASACVSFLNEQGNILCSLTVEPFTLSGSSPTSIRLICDTETSTADIWLNSRVSQTSVPLHNSSIPAQIRFEATKNSFVLRRFSLYDDPEIYAVNDEMRELSDSVRLVKGEASITPFPFGDDSSLLLDESSAIQYRFPAMDCAFTCEVKVRCETSAYCEVPVLLDEAGKPLLRIALYHNNLFATDGNEWKRMISGPTDWLYYPCGNWLLVRLLVDPRQGVYSLYVDGARRVENFSLSHPVSSISSIGFLADAKCSLLINRIRIYDDIDFSRAVLPPAPVFDVKSYGAIGDGVSLDTLAIQEAVNAAAKVGGTVLLQNGTFLTGEIALQSNITFWIDRTAVLFGSQDHALYPLHTPGISLCACRQLGRGLLYGENIHNVRVTGGGLLDGNGLYRFKQNDPVRDRPALSRPCIIYITYSSDITVENIHMRRSCYWTLVPLSCRNVLLRHLDLDCMYTPNRDGIDPVDVCDTTIYDCAVMAGDDGLCFKSSDLFGCERIDVHDMLIQSLASGIKFGTDTYYSLKDAVFRDCTIKNVNRCGISLESVDGAQISNVLFERINMVDVGAPVYIVTGVRGRRPQGNSAQRISHIDDVVFRKLRFEKAYPFSFSRWIHEIMVIGQSDAQTIDHVSFEHCFFSLPGGCNEKPGYPAVINQHYPEYDQHGMSAGSVLTTRFVRHFKVTDLSVSFDQTDLRDPIVHFDALDTSESDVSINA